MCKELEERKYLDNINLFFNEFCNTAKKENKKFLIKTAYIALQYYNIVDKGDLMPDEEALELAQLVFDRQKLKGKIDILNRFVK